MSDDTTATEGTETTDDTSTETTTQETASTTEETDWKAMSRKWEKAAKANSKAAEERDALKAKSMSEQEKAVAEAKAAGTSEAAKTYGSKLAAAELKAAAATKGVDLSSIGDLIDASRFIGEDGEVDTAAIGKAVDKLAKSFTGPKRSGADLGGGNGAGQITEEQLARMGPEQIAKALEEGKLAHLM